MNLSNPNNLIIAGVYYLLAAIMTFFSAFGVYILIRYGKSTLLAFIVSLFYIFFYFILLSASYQTLQNLL